MPQASTSSGGKAELVPEEVVATLRRRTAELEPDAVVEASPNLPRRFQDPQSPVADGMEAERAQPRSLRRIATGTPNSIDTVPGCGYLRTISPRKVSS
jgi:hypothetical protein